MGTCLRHTLLPHNSDIPFAAERSVPEVRHFNISKKRQAHFRNAPAFLIYLCECSYNTSSTGV